MNRRSITGRAEDICER